MVTIGDIRLAARTIGKTIIRTPLVYWPTISRIYHAEIYLKLENLQKTGSFKIRGASYKLQKDRSAIGEAGVVAASAGNHAQGVALAARNLNIPAVIVMPEWVSISKQQAVVGYGGRVLIHGENIGDCLDKAREFESRGSRFIHPFDDPDIISGQGTVGLEILEDLPDADLILVPVGGGGLISGVALSAAAVRPGVRVIGVQAAACPSGVEAVHQGKPIQAEAKPSIADGISVKRIGDLTFQIIQHHVERIVVVEEEPIAAAVLMLLERKKLLAEGAGAVGLAAILSGKVEIPRNSRVVLVISGGNVDSPLLDRIIRQGLVKHGRVMNLRVLLDDRPGSLAAMLKSVAELGANVLRVNHSRHVRGLGIGVARVELEIETRGPEHIAQIDDRLKQLGYDIFTI